MSDSPLLSLNNISFGYTGRPLLFDGLDFTLTEGEQTGIHAPNGSGKTTLLRLAMGLEKAQSGTVLFQGSPVDSAQALHHLRCSVGFVLQNSDEQLFSSTVLEDVAFGPLNLGLKPQEARDRALETLESIGMAALAERPIHQLSGGEKKLVSIATVLSMRPKALLLDEPTTFLDEQSRGRIIRLLQEMGIGRVIVSHDRDFLRQTTASLVTIKDGRIAQCSL